MLPRLLGFLHEQKVKRIQEINVKTLNAYIDWLTCAPKTKKNHIGVISLMLDQAIKEEIIMTNPAKLVTLPKIIHQERHRELNPEDLEIIFTKAGEWYFFYLFLYHTGLRAGDVSILKYENVNLKRKSIVSLVRKSRRIHEFPLSDVLMKHIPTGKPGHEPLFPQLYPKDIHSQNDKLAKPCKHIQMLLKTANRPSATLHSFRTTYNNTLRNMGLQIEDRRVLLAHSTSETTKIYTHPNFELALEYVNKLPEYGIRAVS